MKLARISLVIMLMLALCLTGCINANEGIEELFLVLTEEDFVYLDDYPDLKTLDLTGSTCYDAILEYIDTHPQVDVTYTIALGDTDFPSDSTSLTLEAEDFDYDELMANLKYLPGVTYISLPDVVLTSEQVDAINAVYPGVTVDYSVRLLGNLYKLDVTELNLAGMTSADVEEVITLLPTLSAVTYVDLMDENGQCALTKTDVKTLQEALPGITFNYSFDFFGTTISTADTSVEIFDARIGNDGEQEIRQTLDILTDCTYFKLDDCGVDSTVMASIRDDYPDVKVVWRIYCKTFSMCTDETMVRMNFALTDENSGELQYCTDVTHMDLSNNSLTDLSFARNMPNLECVVLTGNRITDLSPLSEHDSLVWLELTHCYTLEDLSPLSSCDNLKYLNISYTDVENVSALAYLPLERFVGIYTELSSTSEQQFTAQHPNCLARFEGNNVYGYGWYYDDQGQTYFEYYANMRKIFRYDEYSYHGNKKER